MTGLAQTTILDQIEMKADPATGAIVNVFRQDIINVTLNGAPLSTTFQRSAYAANDPAVVALLGQTAASSLVTISSLQAQLTAALGEVEALTEELAAARAQLAPAP